MRKQIVFGMLLFASLLVGTARADEALNRALFVAVADGNLREVQSLISRGADASATYGEITGTLDLREAGIQPNFMTPFSYAVSREHFNQEICRVLARKVNFDIPWKYTDGTNAGTSQSLWDPVYHDNVEIAGILLHRGASIAKADPIFAAAKSTVMADLLLAHGAKVNAKNPEGEAALHKMGDTDVTVAEWMVAHGADVNIINNQGRTPLHLATLRSNVKTVEFLLTHGADVNAKDSEGATPLHMLGSREFEHRLGKSEKSQLVELLLSHGADVNAQDKGGQTPLGRVSATTDQDLIKALQAHGGKTNIGPGELLSQSIAQFKGHSDNETLRAAIIDLSLKQHPASPIPAEAEAAAGRAAYIFRNAKSVDDTLSAAKQYLTAIETAPWVANYYVNLCTVLEKTPYKQQALHACKLYLVADPNAPDAGDMKQRIAGLQYATETDKAQMMQRTAYIQKSGLDDLYRFGGISGKISGKDISLKLAVDWYSAPPRYRILTACLQNDDVYTSTHDLVSTDSWESNCRPGVDMHFVIKPEGEGFVELSDASGGGIRTTLNELFTAQRRTMAQAVMFHASDNQADHYFVTYAQGASDSKHAGYAMYESDCNGRVLKEDPRALPDDFVSRDVHINGGFGRFYPEVVLSQPNTDVCARQFFAKTGFYFGEKE
jgi:ankyrin repeat protein